MPPPPAPPHWNANESKKQIKWIKKPGGARNEKTSHLLFFLPWPPPLFLLIYGWAVSTHNRARACTARPSALQRPFPLPPPGPNP